MRIWIDGDGCPAAVKEMVFKASRRLQIRVTVVANRPIALPKSRLVDQVVVSAGMDVADEHIVAQVQPGDLVVTQDIPLAAEVVAKGAIALEPRGELLDAGTVRQRLAVRDMMTELRASGVSTGGPPPYGPKDSHRFAGALDRLLAKRPRPPEQP